MNLAQTTTVETSNGTCAAIVTKVHSAALVNVARFGPNGDNVIGLTSVPVIAAGAPVPVNDKGATVFPYIQL